MNPVFEKIFVAMALLAAACIAGCAPMTETQRALREYRHAEFRHEFIEYRAECLADGGHIIVTAFGGGVDRDGIPKTQSRYFCS